MATLGRRSENVLTAKALIRQHNLHTKVFPHVDLLVFSRIINMTNLERTTIIIISQLQIFYSHHGKKGSPEICIQQRAWSDNIIHTKILSSHGSASFLQNNKYSPFGETILIIISQLLIFYSHCWKKVWIYANCKGPNQTAHLCSLIRAFAVC